MTTDLADAIERYNVSVGMIWAQTRQGVIGANGTMPWHLPEDLAHFKDVTTGHPVIMGRATWESLPTRFRPLPGRTNIVLSRTMAAPDGVVVADSPASAVAAAAEACGETRECVVWVVGGSQIYRQFTPVADRAVVTVIDADIEGDTFAPTLDARWQRTETGQWQISATALRFQFLTYESGPPTAHLAVP